MAALTLEDTEKALKMYFSGSLGDDVPKPQHRDGRIVVWAPKSRRRLEHVTTEDVASALTCIRTVSDRAFILVVDRYKYRLTYKEIAESRLMTENDVIISLGGSLKTIASVIVTGG